MNEPQATVKELPVRSGVRPTTGPAMPHQQLDQNAPPSLQEELWQRMTQLEGVQVGGSHVSLPDSRALHLDPQLARGPADAYMLGTEFVHLHGPADGSLHAMLPPAVAREAVEKGWAELHPMAQQGFAPSHLVMIYGPRDDAELEIVWRLVEAGYSFARGRETGPA